MKYSIQNILGGLFVLLLFNQTATASSPLQSLCSVQLQHPRSNTSIHPGPLTFNWRFEKPDTVQLGIDRYELIFWSKNNRFKRVYTVYPTRYMAGTKREFEDARDTFKRHGTYFWRVSAYDSTGNRIDSDMRRFVVPVPDMEQVLSGWIYPNDVHFEYVQRLPTREFRSLLNQTQPKVHMESFSKIGFGFRQEPVKDRLFELHEQVVFTSHIGIGVEFQSSMQLMKNSYVSLFPDIEYDMLWFSTGLEYFASNMKKCAIGMDFSLMPRGYVTLHSRWVPQYNIHYREKSAVIRTFEGTGWEGGATFYIPRTIIDIFRLSGIEFDFQRMPFTVMVSRIKDDYTGLTMHMHTITLGYIFH